MNRMFEEYIKNIEFQDINQTQGNLNVNILNKQQEVERNGVVNKVLDMYEQSYNELNVQDSGLAD